MRGQAHTNALKVVRIATPRRTSKAIAANTSNAVQLDKVDPPSCKIRITPQPSNMTRPKRGAVNDQTVGPSARPSKAQKASKTAHRLLDTQQVRSNETNSVPLQQKETQRAEASHRRSGKQNKAARKVSNNVRCPALHSEYCLVSGSIPSSTVQEVCKVVIDKVVTNNTSCANIESGATLRKQSEHLANSGVQIERTPLAEKSNATRNTENGSADKELPGFQARPLHKGNQAFSFTSEVYLVHLALLAIEKRIRGNANFCHELRFNASEVSLVMHKYDPRCPEVVSNNQSGLAKLQRFLRKLNKTHGKWLRSGLPETASVKNPETIKKRQLLITKLVIKSTAFSIAACREHMERMALLCGHMGSHCPEFGVTTVGAAPPSVIAKGKGRKRSSTYEIDEISSDSSEDSDVEALREVESDTDDDGDSPSGRPKTKSVRDELTKNDVTIVPIEGSADPERSLDGTKIKNRGAENTDRKNVIKEEKAKGQRPDAASGRGKRSIPPFGTVPGLEKFVEMIGESTKAQSARGEELIKLEMERRKEEQLFKKLEAPQKLVNDNPGNMFYEGMLERLARKAFNVDSD